MQGRWTDEQTLRHRQALSRELGGELLRALADRDVTEILLNPDGAVWLDTASGGLMATEVRFSPIQAENLFAIVAGLLGRVIDPARPILEADLPLDGSRISALLPPVVTAPVFSIRKSAPEVVPLDRYVEAGDLSPEGAEALRDAIRLRWNILVSGGPGSGKTTFARALLQEMEISVPETERILILEEPPAELRPGASNHVSLVATEALDLRALVRASLRHRPDRIVIGEVRGAEALDLLKAWNTGNPGGCATVHANSAREALERLDSLVQEAGVPAQPRLIATTVDLVVHMERRGSRREVREIVGIESWDSEVGFVVEPI